MPHFSYTSKVSSRGLTQMSTALLTGDSENVQQDAEQKGEQIHAVRWERDSERGREREGGIERENPQVASWTLRNFSTPYSDCSPKEGSFQCSLVSQFRFLFPWTPWRHRGHKIIYNWSIASLTPPVTFWFRLSIPICLAWSLICIALKI